MISVSLESSAVQERLEAAIYQALCLHLITSPHHSALYSYCAYVVLKVIVSGPIRQDHSRHHGEYRSRLSYDRMLYKYGSAVQSSVYKDGILWILRLHW